MGTSLEAREGNVRRELRRRSRRGFLTLGASVAAGVGAWRWTLGRETSDGIPWPFRRILEANEAIARATFSPGRLAPTFPVAVARAPRVNGVIGLEDATDPAAWRVEMSGGAGAVRSWPVSEVRKLPRHEQTTELKCIEGWSTIVTWAGARLADLAAATGLAATDGRPYDVQSPPTSLHSYVSMATPDGSYYVGLDTPSALHPQSLLCYEMNGEPLPPGHGGPLRLVIPVKYGIKNIKQIGSIRFGGDRPGDYWAEHGYDWYAGH